jgi:integrase
LKRFTLGCGDPQLKKGSIRKKGEPLVQNGRRLMPPHGLNPETITVRLPQVKHHEALVLSLLKDGRRSTSEITEAMGWKAEAQGLRHMMTVLEDANLVEKFHTSGRSKGSNGRVVPFFSSEFQITPEGLRLLNEAIDFYRSFLARKKPGRRSSDKSLVKQRQVAVRKRSGERDRPLSVRELNRIMAAALPEFELVLRGLRAGLRSDEICAIDISDVNGATVGGSLTVRVPSGKWRRVPITAELNQVFDSVMTARLQGRVFDTASMTPWADRTISSQFSKALRDAKVPDRVQPCTVLGEAAWPSGARQRPTSWRAMTKSEERAFLKIAPAEASLFYRACKLSGLQRDALRELKWKDVGLDAHSLRVEPGRFEGEFLEVLNEAAKLRFSGPLFLTRAGQRWTKPAFHWQWSRISRQIQLTPEMKLFGRGRRGDRRGRLNVMGRENGAASHDGSEAAIGLSSISGSASPPKFPAMRHPKNPDVAEVCRLLADPKEASKSNNQVVRDFLVGTERDSKRLERKAKSLLRQARTFRHLWEPRQRAES